MIDLHLYSLISCFILGYLMENSQMMRQREGRRLGTGIGRAALVTAVLYIWVMSQHSLEALESLIMLLTIAVYDLICCVDEKMSKTIRYYIV